MKDLALAVRYNTSDNPDVSQEVHLHGEPVLFGTWHFAVQCQDKQLKPAGIWTETCNYTENNCEYLELDLPLTRGFRIQRFFLLNNKDQLLLLGDTVFSEKKCRNVSYQSALYHSPELNVQPEKPFSSLLFHTKKNKPLFRVLPFDESVQMDETTLTIQRQWTGQACFMPLLFDLKPQRLGKSFLWKRLTVGENRQLVPEDKAAGYRIQLGSEQFLLYRSMTAMANRTVLGHNLVDDFCFARFAPKSGVETLVTVQIEN
ncbi:MAG: hypothetical protein LBN39_08890 [Planctomycetaceae bacterium]|jgi:hypothetical protein|nr:hypothetical protein [Planctomycetaceae bacterium]